MPQDRQKQQALMNAVINRSASLIGEELFEQGNMSTTHIEICETKFVLQIL